MNILKSNQNLSMFTSSQSLNLQIYDAGKVDGDKINVFVNDTVLLKNYIVSKKIKQLLIPLQSKLTTVKISALNVGTISPNTAKIEITDQKNNIQTITSLKKGEKTSITIIKTE
jgi:archaellum component FlaF (FlaF/FlaG flagellin family)